MPTKTASKTRKLLKDKSVIDRAIERGYGLLKHKPNGQTFAKEWAEHKREEQNLTEAKYRHYSK